jgi:nucleotide-binding universal stress UspA family protein
MGVISRADVPVLTTGPKVASPGSGAGYHLVVTSDGSPDSRSVFEGLRGLLAAGSIRVTLLQVVTAKTGETDIAAKWRATETLTAQLNRLPDGVDAGIEVRVVPLGADMDAAINATAGELGADAIAMATHGHSARRHLVAGSTALGVLANGELPVILVKSRPVD